MARKGKIAVGSMLFFTAIILTVFLIMQPAMILLFRDKIALLFPSGRIAIEQRNLLFISQIIMLIVVIPVFALTFIFCWKYHAGNPKGKYDPDLVDNVLAEFVWWGVPLVLTVIISVITWIKTHELDPFKPIPSDKQTKIIQVVALQYKWLFIYPEEKIASMNFVQFPKHTPIHFEITADAPMNSFWIPHLGGQIYAMPSMKTELHLIADETGDFRGSSANLSGEGFAAMHFIARASEEEEYNQWIASAKQSSNSLDREGYNKMIAPSENDSPESFQLKDEGLFEHIIMKYMHPEEK